MEDMILTSAGVAAALVQTAARPLLPTRWLPLCSVLIGVGVVACYWLAGDIELRRVPLNGLLAGLVASGGFDLAKRTFTKGNES